MRMSNVLQGGEEGGEGGVYIQYMCVHVPYGMHVYGNA